MDIKYLGQCGFLIESKDARVVTDPHLSDVLEETHYCEKTPWRRLYPPPCTLFDLSPDLIVISHAHDDHLDPTTVKEYLKKGGDALFVAPSPICYLLEKIGVKSEKIICARAEEEIVLGGFSIKPIPCAHTEFHTGENGDFFELSYFIKADGKCLFFGGDMSLYSGLCERLKSESPDILLLPCNGRDDFRTSLGIIGNISEVEAASLAAKVGAPFIPMHHDLYALNGCSEEKIVEAAKNTGAEIILKKCFEI